MKNTRASRFQLLVDLSRKEEESFAEQLKQRQDTATEQHQQLVNLQQYYEDYSKQLSLKTVAVNAAKLVQSREFLQRLATAESVQKQKCCACEKALENIKSTWRVSHLRTKNLERLAKKCEHEALKVLDKKEQQLIDEWVNQVQRR